MLGQTDCRLPPDRPILRLFKAEILRLCRLAKFATTQKALIPLHFGNPELHNKLLAFRHPNMG
jgi:hypothetical protein